MAISNKLTTVASGVKDIRAALKEIDSNFGAGHISTLDDEIRQIGSEGTLVFYKDSEGNYKTKLCTNVNSIKSSVSGDIIAIILPENVDEIGRSSLSSLTSLEFINLQNVTYFNALSFSSNTIAIDASQDLRNAEWIAGSAFSGCTGLTGELYLPKLKGFAYKNDRLTNESFQFNRCSGLTKVMDLGSISSINNSTFTQCINLTEIHFPETLNIISGDNAFRNDTKLSKIYFKSLESALNVDYVNNTRHPFYSTSVTPREVYINDQLLTNLVIPNTVTSIKAYALYRNTVLASVTIPSSVTSIGNNAFHQCTELQSIVIPSSVTSIGGSAFRECTGLTGTLTIPNSVTSIGGSAFRECTRLTEVSINGVTTLNGYLFYGCSSLETLHIEGITNRESTNQIQPFAGCTKLSKLYLSSIEQLMIINNDGRESGWSEGPFVPSSSVQDHYLYVNGTEVRDLVVPSGWNVIKSSTFCYLNRISSITIPEGVTTIYNRAFAGCQSATTISLPSTLTWIGPEVFRGCASLTTINLPEGLTNIEASAFQSCNLTTITIPSTVTNIGSYAFAMNYNLESITILATVPPTLVNTNAFIQNSQFPPIYVPAESVDAYKTANIWSQIADKIQAIA